MKFASLNSGRDGQLILVSRDLQSACDASDIAATLQNALDEWDAVQAALQYRYDELNQGQCSNTFVFCAADCASPLPRAFQWADGSAYVNHVELVRRAPRRAARQLLA